MADQLTGRHEQARALKVGLALFFLFAAYVFLKLRSSAPTGYEISLYANTPWEAWLLIVVSGLGGIGLIVWQALSRSRGSAWVYGFLLMILGNLVIVSLWDLRGYVNWAGNDVNAHYGMVTDYIATGHVKDTNPYPIFHLAMVQAQLLTGLSVASITKIYPAFLTAVSMVLVLVLAKMVVKEKGAALLAVAATAPLLYGLYHTKVYPRGLGQVLLPGMIWLYLWSKSQRNPWASVSLLLSIGAFTFVHPMVTIFFLVFLGIHELSLFGARLWVGWASGAKWAGVEQAARAGWAGLSLTPLLFGAVWFSKWFFVVRGLSGGLITQIATNIAGGSQSDWIPKAMSVVDVSGWKFVEFFLKVYGANWAMWALAGIGMILVVKRFVKRDTSVEPLFVLLPWVILTNIAWVPFFTFVGGSALIETNTLSAVAAVFAGWLLWYLFGRSAKGLSLKVVAVTGIIAIAAALGVLSLYRSPYLFQGSFQMLKSDIVANRWMLDRKLPYVQYTGIGVPYTVAFLNLGEGAVDYDRPDLNVSVQWTGILLYNKEQIPSHFGYNTHPTFGEQFVQSKYVMLTKRFDITRNDPTLRYRGHTVGPSIGRWDFDDTDLVRWEQDATVDRVYDNGETRAYLAHGRVDQIR